MTLYEAIYGRKPSQIPPYKKDATSVQAVDEWLQDRHALLLLFKTNIREAKERMKQKTDADQHEVNFEVGDNVQREVLRNGRIESQFLVQWSSEPHENSTWVPTEHLRKLYPEFHLEDKVLATLLQNQELLDDLSTKESRNLLALAQGIRATPWPIEESDDEVNEADLQAALEASKKANNVVPFSSSSTVSLPVSFSPSLVSSLPSAVVCSNMPSSSTLIDKRLFLNSHFDDCSALKSVVVSHEESVPSNLPCVSVDFADVRARVLSTQSILTSLKSTVVRMEKVLLLDDKKLLQSFEAGDVGSDSAPAR
nr:Transposon Ty3-G Gag-Pol polyprotein [Ipomoea batatas]